MARNYRIVNERHWNQDAACELHRCGGCSGILQTVGYDYVRNGKRLTNTFVVCEAHAPQWIHRRRQQSHSRHGAISAIKRYARRSVAWLRLRIIASQVADDDLIDRLSLSSGTSTCLAKAGVTTIHELLTCSKQELRSLRNLGPKRLSEISMALAALGASMPERGWRLELLHSERNGQAGLEVRYLGKPTSRAEICTYEGSYVCLWRSGYSPTASSFIAVHRSEKRREHAKARIAVGEHYVYSNEIRLRAEKGTNNGNRH